MKEILYMELLDGSFFLDEVVGLNFRDVLEKKAVHL